jgi:hypothetical protein
MSKGLASDCQASLSFLEGVFQRCAKESNDRKERLPSPGGSIEVPTQVRCPFDAGCRRNLPGSGHFGRHRSCWQCSSERGQDSLSGHPIECNSNDGGSSLVTAAEDFEFRATGTDRRGASRYGDCGLLGQRHQGTSGQIHLPGGAAYRGWSLAAMAVRSNRAATGSNWRS